MKCLLAADLHYDLRKFDWVVGASPHVDLVVLAGDHLDRASLVERPAQAVVAEKYFRRIRERAPLLVCSGNHDLDIRDGHGELTARWIGRSRHYGVPGDGDSLLIGDTLFSIYPWWDGEIGLEGVVKLLARDVARRPANWVWVVHAPPVDSPISWGGKRSYGAAELRAWIEEYQPQMVLSGHVHQAPFVQGGSWADRIGQSWVFNAGYQMGPFPTCIVIDTEEGFACWVSLAGAEVAALDAPADPPFAPLEDPPAWITAMARGAAPREEQTLLPADG